MLPFSNKYTLLVVIILLVLIFLIFVEKFDNIKDFFMGFDFKFKMGDKELGIKPNDSKKPSQEVFNKSMEANLKESKEAKLKIKEALGKKNEKNNEDIKNDEVRELKILLENVRYFSAYNNTNHTCSDLLIYLYKRKSVSKIEFEEKLREYYSKRIRGVNKKQKKECINRKIEEKIFNYKYLDIIEISDDNEYIILTDSGKKFVIDYLKKGVEEDV